MTISLRGVFKIYESSAGNVAALRGVDLEIPTGQVCVVRGPNGSGKSTLIETLTGGITPSAGTFTITTADGSDARISTIRQFNNVLTDLTVAEHVDLIAKVQGIKSFDATSHLAEWHIDHIAAQRLSVLSSGEQQRVALAVAMISKPHVLLADEPTGALGPEESLEVYAHITNKCREQGTTLLLVTHDVMAEQFADRIVRIRDGRISEEWTPGGAERTVVDDDGWLRLPNDVRSNFGHQVAIHEGTDSAQIERVDEPRDSSSITITDRVAPLDRIAISAGDLSVTYPGSETLLGGVSLDIPERSVTVIYGTSGIGKTSLLRIIAGLQDYYSGSVSVFGTPWTEQSRDVRAGRRTEEISLVSTELPIGYAGSLRTLGADPLIVDALSLTGLFDRPLNSLSGGQRQRAVNALALSRDIRILLLDEPTSALDEPNTHLVMQQISAARNAGKTVVVTTHDESLMSIADQVIRL